MTPIDAQKHEKVLIEWENYVYILNNIELWRNILIGFGVPSLIMGGIFGWIGRFQDGLLLGFGLLFFFLVIFMLIGVVIDLSGGFLATFLLTTEGVRFYAGKGAKRVATVATVTGLLLRSMSTAGAGFLAREEQKVFIPWKEVKKISLRGRRHFILVKGPFGQKPIGLYCTENNYRQVLDTLRLHCPSHRFSA